MPSKGVKKVHKAEEVGKVKGVTSLPSSDSSPRQEHAKMPSDQANGETIPPSNHSSSQQQPTGMPTDQGNGATPEEGPTPTHEMLIGVRKQALEIHAECLKFVYSTLKDCVIHGICRAEALKAFHEAEIDHQMSMMAIDAFVKTHGEHWNYFDYSSNGRKEIQKLFWGITVRDLKSATSLVKVIHCFSELGKLVKAREAALLPDFLKWSQLLNEVEKAQDENAKA